MPGIGKSKTPWAIHRKCKVIDIQKEAYEVVVSGPPVPFYLTHHWYEGAIGPKTEGTLQYCDKIGFVLEMCCYETSPRAVFCHSNDPVYTDSCMEAFIDFFPGQELGYLNVEINANGAVYCSFGVSRNKRRLVVELGQLQPTATVTRCAHGWQVSCLIKKDFLEGLYHRSCDFKPGQLLRGNFYKCGDKTEAPHWCSWQPLNRLDFHSPECFGEIMIVETSLKSACSYRDCMKDL